MTVSPLHLTRNQVQGLTRVASQVRRTLFGSTKLFFNALSASPVLKKILNIKLYGRDEASVGKHGIIVV